MLPFVAFCLRAPPVSLRGNSAAGAGEAAAGGAGGGRPPLAARLRGSLRAVGADASVLLRHPVYLWAVGGMTFYTAVLGAYAFYGPKAGRDVFAVAPERADLTFGAITVLTGGRPGQAGLAAGQAGPARQKAAARLPWRHARCGNMPAHSRPHRSSAPAGVLGTLAGGALLDAVGASMRNALLLCAAGIAVGALLAVAAFWAAGSFAAFSLSFAAAELAMFVSQVGWGGGWGGRGGGI